MAETQCKEIEAFGWRVWEKISESIENMKNVKLTQNMSNKEKQPLIISFMQKHQNNHKQHR